jgi:hypothetical protein
METSVDNILIDGMRTIWDSSSESNSGSHPEIIIKRITSRRILKVGYFEPKMVAKKFLVAMRLS